MAFDVEAADVDVQQEIVWKPARLIPLLNKRAGRPDSPRGGPNHEGCAFGAEPRWSSNIHPLAVMWNAAIYGFAIRANDPRCTYAAETNWPTPCTTARRN